MAMSHPTWVRGLKSRYYKTKLYGTQSHPTWVRGLKLILPILIASRISRTPRGCVD